MNDTKVINAINKRIISVETIYAEIKGKEERTILLNIISDLKLLLEIRKLDIDKSKNKDTQSVLLAADKIINLYN